MKTTNLGKPLVALVAALFFPPLSWGQVWAQGPSESEPPSPLVAAKQEKPTPFKSRNSPVAYDHWSIQSLRLLSEVGISENWPDKRWALLSDLRSGPPLPEDPSRAFYTRQEIATVLGRLLEQRFVSPKKFVMPPLAQSNSWFYRKNALGDWISRNSREEIRDEVFKLFREYGSAIISSSDQSGPDEWKEKIEEYFKASPSPAASSGIEVKVALADASPNSAEVGEVVKIRLAATINMPPGCQLKSLPIWKWEIVTVKWQATPEGEWSNEDPHSHLKRTSAEDAGMAEYEGLFDKVGNWRITVQVKGDYDTTTMGRGSAMAQAIVQ